MRILLIYIQGIGLHDKGPMQIAAARFVTCVFFSIRGTNGLQMLCPRDPAQTAVSNLNRHCSAHRKCVAKAFLNPGFWRG